MPSHAIVSHLFAQGTITAKDVQRGNVPGSYRSSFLQDQDDWLSAPASRQLQGNANLSAEQEHALTSRMNAPRQRTSAESTLPGYEGGAIMPFPGSGGPGGSPG